jgi:hypothetical protein
MGKMEELQALIRSAGKEYSLSETRFNEFEKNYKSAESLEDKEKLLNDFKKQIEGERGKTD